ncbi:MAG TPA: beta-propeller fold lactonase family protein [Acidisarcina sp.]|nr:beta-propeller fold lactonase family protein [Acidisarcina sp.]
MLPNGMVAGRAMRGLAGLALAAALLLSGCGKFFVPEINTPGGTGGSGGGGGTTSTTAFLYVANAATGGQNTNPAIAGFSTPGSTLAVLPQSPYAVGCLPSALAITPGNKFLYVGCSDGPIFVYTVNSDGSLTGNSGAPVATAVAPVAMKVDATGNWLLAAVNSFSGISSLAIFQINSSTGALTAASSSPVTLDTGSPNHIAITPNNQIVYVSLGTGGVDILSFNSNSGAAAVSGLLKPKDSRGADTALAVNPAGTYLYVGETVGSGLRVLKIATDGALTEISGSPFQTGLGPSAVVVDSAGANVYVTNRSDNTISGFAVAASGALTALAGSPYATGSTPVDMAIDSTKGYLAVVCSGGSPDLQLFNFDQTTAGKLNAVAHATTGTDPTTPLAIVASH